jgi:periplasmic protein thiol:disulfide oxidoreductases, DsbE subfamily
MRRAIILIPLVVFVALAVLLAVGLTRNPAEVPSPLIGKPAPQFRVPTLADPERTIGNEDLKGQVTLVNVWASWCVACRDEHPVLMELAARKVAPIVGLDYKDAREDGLAWLSRFGNPYQQIAYDRDGRVGLDWGVYGVPETFVLDRHGVIRYKHIGPITRQTVQETLLPLIERLKQEN